MAQPALCIDTDILIDFLRASQAGGERILEAAIARYTCALPSVAVYEVCVGIERHGRRHDWRILRDLLTLVEIVPFDLAAARASARVDAALQRSGLMLAFPDLFIAGTCLARKMPLLTRNVAHFARVPRLRLLNPQELLRG